LPTPTSNIDAEGMTMGGQSEFRGGWRTLIGAAVGVGSGVTGALVYSVGLFLEPVSRNFGWSRTEISAGSLFTVAGLIVTAPITGRIADRLGVRTVGMGSLALLAVLLLSMTQVRSAIWTYYAGLFMISVVGSGTTPIVWARGVASWFDAHRGFALALMLLGTGAAGVLTPLVLGGLIQNYGWKFGYLGLAVVAVVAIIPVYFLFRERELRDPEAQAMGNAIGLTVKEAAATRDFWIIVAAFAFIAPAISAILIHLVAMLVGSGVERPFAVKIAGFLGASVIIGRLSIGYALDRFPPPIVSAIVFLIPAAGCLLAALVPGIAWVMIVATASFGFAAGAEVDLLAFLVSRHFGLRHYSSIYGLQFAIFEIGVGVGPLLAGYSFDVTGSYHLALLVGAVMFAAGSGIFLLLRHIPHLAPLSLEVGALLREEG
jgi:MFS family permease